MKKTLLTFILIGFSILAFSQQNPNSAIGNNATEPASRLVSITGTITDNSGMPLIGVNVIVKETKLGTQTDSKGYYSIKAKKGNVLVFSFVGMHTQEVTLEDNLVLDILLNENIETLKEVVVNAEKISRKEKARSYASTVITSDKLIKGGYTNVMQALQGTVAGFHGGFIRGGTTFEGTPPLYILDGAPTDIGFLENNININEVEKVEVIKSASQSLRYGPRATGGVIIVTTKFHNNFLEGNIGYSDISSKVREYQGSLKVEESILDEPYIRELSKANSVEEAYNMYVKQRDQYGHLPKYYLDVYNYFKKWNNRDYELRILFNDVITDYHNPEQLKALAYLLESAKEYKLAINIYTQVLRLFPGDLQSYRDLALVYKDIGLVQESVAILNSLTADESNDNGGILQFSDIDDILMNDAVQLGNDGVGTTYDVRVVVDWNRYDANINLQVIDPTREICYYENPTTKQGGQLAQNMSRGYGPEEFTLKNAKKGSYFVMVNYSLKDLEETTKPTFVKLTIFKDYGKPTETTEIKVLQLVEPQERLVIAKLDLY